MQLTDLKIAQLEAFNACEKYRLIEIDIYTDLHDQSGFGTSRMAVSMPLGQIVSLHRMEEQFEDFLVYVEQTFVEEENDAITVMLGGELEDIKKFKSQIKSKSICIV